MIKLLKKNNIIFLGIFLLAVLMRTILLGNVPLGLHADEIANAYGTKFILLHGIDIYGHRLPLLYLDKFGDYPPILPMYLSGLGAFLFGNTEFGARIFIAIVGALAIIPMYRIGFRVFKRKETALFVSFILAIAPWHISLSRLSAEGIIALTVFLFGVDLLFTALEKRKNNLLIMSFIILLSTYLIYPSFRIIVPLFLLPLVIVHKRHKIFDKHNIVYFLLPIITLGITLYISRQPWGTGRFEQTSIVSPLSGVANKLQTLIFNEDSIPVARIFNNKIIGYSKEFIFQYSRYFSFNFLFGEDGIPPIYITPYVGLLYTSLLPLIFLSFFGFIQNKNKNINNPFFLYLLYLLLISPIPAALTVLDVPSIHRAILTPVIVIMLAGYGFNGLFQIRYKKISVIIPVFFLIFGEFVFFTHNYFQHISYYTTQHRNPGNKQVVDFIKQNYESYDVFYATNEEQWLPTYYLYYSNIYGAKLAGKFTKNFRLPKIGKVYFPEDSCSPLTVLNKAVRTRKLSVPKKTIFIYKDNCKPFQEPLASVLFKEIQTIKALDEIVVYHITEINPDYSDQKLDDLINLSSNQ